MPLLIVVVGVALMVSALRNSQSDLFNLLASDVPGYAVTAGGIVAIGLLGYIPHFEKPARLLLALVVLVVVLKNGGAFNKLQQAFANPPAPSKTEAPANKPLGPLPIQFAGGGGNASGVGSAISAAKGVADLFGIF